MQDKSYRRMIVRVDERHNHLTVACAGAVMRALAFRVCEANVVEIECPQELHPRTGEPALHPEDRFFTWMLN